MPKNKKLAKGQPAGSVGTKTEGYYKDIDTNEKEDKRLGVWKNFKFTITVWTVHPHIDYHVTNAVQVYF